MTADFILSYYDINLHSNLWYKKWHSETQFKKE